MKLSFMLKEDGKKAVSKIPYFREYEIYAFWRYINGHLTGRSVFQFRDLMAPKVSEMLAMQFFASYLALWKIKLVNPIFHKEIYLSYCSRDGYKKAEEYLIRNEGKPNAKSLQNILDNNFNIEDIDRVSSMLLSRFGILEFIEFDKDIPKEDKDKISLFLDSYIDDFIADDLEKTDVNFMNFSNQKDKTISLLEEYKSHYGDNFILKYEMKGDYLNPSEVDDYLFVHSIIALDKLGFIKVHKVWLDDDVAPENQTDDYKIKLSVLSLSPAEIEVPQVLKNVILQVLYSLHIGKPNPKDIEYVNYQVELDPTMKLAYNETRIEWLHYFLTRNHGVSVDNPSLVLYMRSLWLQGLIEVPWLEQPDHKNIKKLYLYSAKPMRLDSFWVCISQSGIKYIEDSVFQNGKTEAAVSPKQDVTLIFTEDGRLFFPDHDPIFDLTETQKALLKELFLEEAGHIHKTIDIEQKVYGDSTKKTQENLKKLVQRVNKILSLQFKIPEFIRYKTDTIRRLV